MKKWNELPKEIKDKMLEEQERQTGKRDPQVFVNDLDVCKSYGGFDWENTIEGHDFWRSITYYDDFDIFYKKYPKQSQYPKVMWVSEYIKEDGTLINPRKRVVFMEKNGYFVAWSGASTIEEAEKVTSTCGWNYAKDIEEPHIIELTIEDISNGKGVGVDPKLIRIKKMKRLIIMLIATIAISSCSPSRNVSKAGSEHKFMKQPKSGYVFNNPQIK